MSNVVEQFTPNPVTHEHGENGCCKNPRAWEMEMMHQVWAAGLHDAANCFQDALEAKWKLESQRKVKPKTNSDRIRSMTDKELAKILNGGCPSGGAKCNGHCFDGIGGFPFLWEQLNGKGSCLWASEIEEFPMAVTKKQFG